MAHRHRFSQCYRGLGGFCAGAAKSNRRASGDPRIEQQSSHRVAQGSEPVVERQDLSLLSYLGDTREEIDLLEEKVPKLLGLS